MADGRACGEEREQTPERGERQGGDGERQGVLVADGVAGSERAGAELGAAEGRRHGVGEVGAQRGDAATEDRFDDQAPDERADDAGTWARKSDPIATPIAASSAAPSPAPAMCAMSVAVESVTWSWWAAMNTSAVPVATRPARIP